MDKKLSNYKLIENIDELFYNDILILIKKIHINKNNSINKKLYIKGEIIDYDDNIITLNIGDNILNDFLVTKYLIYKKLYDKDNKYNIIKELSNIFDTNNFIIKKKIIDSNCETIENNYETKPNPKNIKRIINGDINIERIKL